MSSWIAKLSSSEHKRLKLQDMSHFLEFLSKEMDVRAHGHLVFSALHFKRWYERLMSEMKDIVKE